MPAFFLALTTEQQWLLIVAVSASTVFLLTLGICRTYWRRDLRAMEQLSEQQRKEQHGQLREAEKEFQALSVEKVRWQERAQALSERLKQLDGVYRHQIEEQQQSHDQMTDQLQTLQAELARERQARKLEHRHAQEKLMLLENNKAQLLKEFEALSGKIFEQKQQQFAQQSEHGIQTVLAPFREQLDGLRKKVEEVYVSDSRDRASLKTQLGELQRLNQQMSEEAKALTTALRGENKTQGNWGELLLESVLESSGLREGEEFVREQVMTNEEGRRYRPDVIINLPDDRHIIVDAKVSLNAYTDYVNAASELEQAAALKRHLDSVRQHIRGLSGKAYQQLNGVNTPDFVFMFMPVEPSFVVAFQEDDSLFADAFEQKVVVVTPTTLLASLRTVASLWAIERRNRNTEQLADQASKLYDKLVVVVDRYEKLGVQIGTLNKTYDDAWNSMKTGRGNLLHQADQFRKLGVRVKKELAKPLVDDANAESELHQAQLEQSLTDSKTS